MRRLLTMLGLTLLAHAGAQDLQQCGGQPGLPAGIQDGVYGGTLGGRPITLQIDREGGAGSRYVYDRIGLDITLTPFREGSALVLQEEVRKTAGSETVVTGCFNVTPASGALRGRWHAPGQQGTLPVELKVVDVARQPLRLAATPGLLKLRHDDPFAFLKLNHAWVTAPGGRSVREPLSGIVYPRVPGANAALNGALQDRQLQHAADALDCRSQLSEYQQGAPGDSYGLHVSVPFLGPKLLSVREDVYYDCGGAHPDNYTQGLILDRATGRPVKVTQPWPGLSAAKQEALYLAHPSPDTIPECRDVLTAGGLEFTAHLSPAGLNLTPTSLPHVVAACGETAVIPYAELKALADTRSPYYKDLYPR